MRADFPFSFKYLFYNSSFIPILIIFSKSKVCPEQVGQAMNKLSKNYSAKYL